MANELVKPTPVRITAGGLSKWLSIYNCLPLIDQKVWVRFGKNDGKPRDVDPVVAAEFVVFQGSVCFCLDPVAYDDFYGPAYCPRVGLLHWQSRINAIPPSPHIESTDVVKRTRKKMILSSEERERRAERMRVYWQKQRGEMGSDG